MKVFEETKNWGDAETTCISNGGHLATIESKTQNDWIISQTSTSIADWPTVWHGATDQFSEGTWTDAVGQNALSFLSWETTAGQPNGGESEYPGIENNCAMMAGTGNWYDRPCTIVAVIFVCGLESGKKPHI